MDTVELICKKSRNKGEYDEDLRSVESIQDMWHVTREATMSDGKTKVKTGDHIKFSDEGETAICEYFVFSQNIFQSKPSLFV